jgi:ubiquinone/menaquinone biosynthesis C-methylase UbiE
MDIRSDANGLIARELTNRTNEKLDFTSWVIEKLDIKPGYKVLDIGCGTGKQIFSIAKDVLEKGEITGIDKSTKALSIINQKVEQFGYKHINTMCLDIDEIPQRVKKSHFDLIYSVYAFYYSKDMVSLLNELKENLKGSGRIMLLGPGVKSNKELIDIINSIDNRKLDYYNDYLFKSDIENLFDTIEIERFENVVAIKTTEDFKSWFKSSELFDPKYSERVHALVEQQINDHGQFKLTKETVLLSLKNI